MIKFITGLFVIVQVYAQLETGCIIDIAELNPQPLVFDRNYQFIYPPSTNEDGNRNVTLAPGSTIIITCPGGNLNTDQGLESSTIYASCNLESKLVYDDKFLNFSSISCSKERLETLRVTLETCGPAALEIIIGFEIGLDINFVPLVTVCFDFQARTTIWTNYHLTSSLNLRETINEVYINDTNIFNLNGISFAELHDVTYQRTFINNLVGLNEYERYYIANLPFFIEPLSRPTNFFYKTQINASAHYINTMPMWVNIAGYYNWQRTETSIQQWVRDNQVDLQVYTGTYGTCTLPHAETGEPVKIYLYKDPSGLDIYPIPEVFWKLIFDPRTRRATAFITVNNPYILNITDVVLCDDISDGIPWLNWIDKTSVAHGYSYACTYHEFKEVANLPQLDVLGILV